MKKMNLAKCVVVLVITFVASLSTYAAKMNNNLIYNAQEVNGLKVAETVYKKDGNMLTNYMKYNYKYNDNNQMTENIPHIQAHPSLQHRQFCIHQNDTMAVCLHGIPE